MPFLSRRHRFIRDARGGLRASRGTAAFTAVVRRHEWYRRHPAHTHRDTPAQRLWTCCICSRWRSSYAREQRNCTSRSMRSSRCQCISCGARKPGRFRCRYSIAGLTRRRAPTSIASPKPVTGRMRRSRRASPNWCVSFLTHVVSDAHCFVACDAERAGARTDLGQRQSISRFGHRGRRHPTPQPPRGD